MSKSESQVKAERCKRDIFRALESAEDHLTADEYIDFLEEIRGEIDEEIKECEGDINSEDDPDEEDLTEDDPDEDDLSDEDEEDEESE